MVLALHVQCFGLITDALVWKLIISGVYWSFCSLVLT